MNVTVVIGVRPHYVKACGLQEVLKDSGINLTFLDVHQHYDEHLRDVYLKTNGLKVEVQSSISPSNSIPLVDFVRQIADVGKWLTSSEGKKSKALLVLGDANPAFASSIAANRLGVPIIHLEAGVRRIVTEKEHWNSLVTDHLSHLRYCYTSKNLKSLYEEGLHESSYLVGDVLAEWTIEKARNSKSKFLDYDYCLVSIHRPQNCNLNAIQCLCNSLKILNKKIFWILHPRTELFRNEIESSLCATVLPPQSHDEALGLLKNAALIVTDSGGFVREGVLLERAVVVCHEQGMWEELVENNVIVRADMTEESLKKAFEICTSRKVNYGKDLFLIKDGISLFKHTLISFLKRI